MMKGWQKGALISGGIAFFVFGVLAQIFPKLGEPVSMLLFPLMIPLFIILIGIGVDMRGLSSTMSSASPIISKLSMISLVTAWYALLGAIVGYFIFKSDRRTVKLDES
jgi:hypothetical protein